MVNLLVKKANSFGDEEKINKKELKEKLEKEIAYLDMSKASSIALIASLTLSHLAHPFPPDKSTGFIIKG